MQAAALVKHEVSIHASTPVQAGVRASERTSSSTPESANGERPLLLHAADE